MVAPSEKSTGCAFHLRLHGAIRILAYLGRRWNRNADADDPIRRRMSSKFDGILPFQRGCSTRPQREVAWPS